MAARLEKSLVARKLKLTVALVTAALALSVIGGVLGYRPLFYIGLGLLLTSPFISLIIIIRKYG